MKINKVYKGAIILAIGSFITKILGALYRVPLTSLLGVELLGIYQMVFPMYTALLDISSAGVPSGISKLIANDAQNKKRYLIGGLFSFGAIGFLAFLLMFVLARPLSVFQGNVSAVFVYKVLSPAVFLVAIIACFRGYFQGQMNMRPTAFSQIIEQAVKFLFGILFITKFNVFKSKVLSAIFAVVLSECFALLYLLIVFFITDKKCKTILAFKLDSPLIYNKPSILKTAKSVLKTSLPIMLLSVIFPIGCLVESSFIIRFLTDYGYNGVTIFGLYSGAATSVVNLPVSVCYGLAVVAVPTLSGKIKISNGKISSQKILILLTFLFSFIGALCLVLFSPLAVKILFPKLGDYRSLTVNLIRTMSVSVIFISLLQTLHSCLIAKGKTHVAIINAVLAVALKIILTLVLVKIPKLGVFGAVISNTLCYLLAVFLNLMYIKLYGNKKDTNRTNPNG